MKKAKFALVALIISAVIALAGCSSSEEYTFTGEVTGATENTIAISVTEGDVLASSDSVIAVFPDDVEIDAMVGDIVQVTYDGSIQETYPAQVNGISYEIIQRGQTETEAA